MKVLLTGAKGQLGRSLQDLVDTDGSINLIPTDLEELDITDQQAVNRFFGEHDFDYCVNCAAYTAVDKAESEVDFATLINVQGVGNLARACLAFDCKFIHISTDFVFEGKAFRPYTETDIPNPISVYGKTKREGEELVEQILENYFILRTAWVYSEYGSNFLKTMIRLSQERSELTIISDQVGTPTYARDLAGVIALIIKAGTANYGIYHYSNEGVASWYDFAMAIFEDKGISCKLRPIKTEQYPTPAKRPFYSVLDKSKIKHVLAIEIPYWRESLSKCLNNIQ